MFVAVDHQTVLAVDLLGDTVPRLRGVLARNIEPMARGAHQRDAPGQRAQLGAGLFLGDIGNIDRSAASAAVGHAVECGIFHPVQHLPYAVGRRAVAPADGDGDGHARALGAHREASTWELALELAAHYGGNVCGVDDGDGVDVVSGDQLDVHGVSSRKGWGWWA
ncbi:Uncharacterised protein [Mycobacteroides abscessus subsp. abscessus]|nr:Uncharacterised protein [Mycobacteroides abscessus subsp. abscessus]